MATFRFYGIISAYLSLMSIIFSILLLLLSFSQHSFFFFSFFDVDEFLQSLLNFLQYCCWFYVLFFVFFWPQGMWDLSSPMRDWLAPHALGSKVLTTWPPRKSPTSTCFCHWLYELLCMIKCLAKLQHSLKIKKNFFKELAEVLSRQLQTGLSTNYLCSTAEK